MKFKAWFFVALSAFSLSSHANSVEGITCVQDIAPASTVEKFVLARTSDSSFALARFGKSSRGEVTTGLLAKDLQCVQAKSDFMVFNCGSSDATLTVIKHTYLSAGSFRDPVPGGRDIISSYHRIYFRNDSEKIEIDKRFTEGQCRAASAEEIGWVEELTNQ